MLYCESCRVLKNYKLPALYPYHDQVHAECEICNRKTECYNYPALLIKPDNQKTTEDRQLEQAIQNEYEQKTKQLVITYVRGPGAGKIDPIATEAMRQVWVKTKLGTDWYATYELRKKMQQGYIQRENK